MRGGGLRGMEERAWGQGGGRHGLENCLEVRSKAAPWWQERTEAQMPWILPLPLDSRWLWGEGADPGPLLTPTLSPA